MLFSNFFVTNVAHAARALPDLYDGRTAIKPGAPLDKHEWEFAGKTFVFSNKKGCSGRNLTPSEASDLLVSLMQR